MKETITFEDFLKLDIRSATIVDVEDIEKSEKLIKLTLDAGELGKKTVYAGIKKFYDSKDLIGKQTIFLANLEPRKMMGGESEGMILALDTSDEDKPILLVPSEAVDNGATVR